MARRGFHLGLRTLRVTAHRSELARIAPESGMLTLRSSGLRAIYDGLTSVEEVLRETIHEN